jgi:Arc/MetJ-type ribon-helix-helix transcriptional regulator
MVETSQSTIRLTDEDRTNVDKILASGAATNTSEAIRVALAEYARELDTPGPAMKKHSFERLVALAAVDREKFPATKLEAERELLRRGFFPNGLGHWVEDRPDTTVRVPGYSKRR